MEMVDIDVELQANDIQQVADLAIDRVVDVRLLAARCFARALQPGKTYLAQYPSIFAKAIRALKSDQSASVRNEVRSIDISPFSNGATDSEVDDLLNEETSDSSDDDASPRSDSRTSTAQSLFGSADRATSSVSESHDQKAPNKYANGVTSYRSNSLANGEPQDTFIDEDNSDDDGCVDLESSTIYELDLEDLASSSTYLPTLADSLQSPTRDTPPLRNRSSGSLASTRLSNTPPNRSCQSERAGNASPWHFSMRDDEQYVTIDVTGHA